MNNNYAQNIDNMHCADHYKDNAKEGLNNKINNYQSSYHLQYSINKIANNMTNSSSSLVLNSSHNNCDSPLSCSHSTAPISTSDSAKTRSINFQGLSSNSSSSIQGNSVSLQNKNVKYQNIYPSSSSPLISSSNNIDHNLDVKATNTIKIHAKDYTDGYESSQWSKNYNAYHNVRTVNATNDNYLFNNNLK